MTDLRDTEDGELTELLVLGAYRAGMERAGVATVDEVRAELLRRLERARKLEALLREVQGEPFRWISRDIGDAWWARVYATLELRK